MFLPIALAVFVILVFYVLKRYVVEYVQWFRGVLHMRTLPGPPTKWGIGHMHMVGRTFYVQSCSFYSRRGKQTNLEGENLYLRYNLSQVSVF